MTSKSEEAVREVGKFPADFRTMASMNADINSTDTPSSSTDSEFEEYALPSAKQNEIQPYRFEPTVERSEEGASENVSRDDDVDSGAENISHLENMEW